MATTMDQGKGVPPGKTIDPTDLESFATCLRYSDRILALCGAGLSAASGLPTFRGAGGLWRSHDAVKLATPEAFKANPSLVWTFYSFRRHMALQAKPNAAHFALAELARRKKGFLTLTQNVDGLSPRAGHDKRQIMYLHGSLFDIKCSAFFCDYKEANNFTDPIVPALAIPTGAPDPAPLGSTTSGEKATESLSGAMSNVQKELDISDERVEIPQINPKDLPLCPKCKTGLLRPGVVWFNEMLPRDTLDEVDAFIRVSHKIDLMIVIGTSAQVYPAAGYVDEARAKGARVAVINMDRDDTPGGRHGLQHGDWFFQGDASVIVPELFRGEIGEVKHLVQE